MRKILGVAALLAGACAGQQTSVGFAVVGLAAGQTARINVLNEAVASGRGGAAGPCKVTLRFLGAEGELLKERVLEELGAGKIAFLDLKAEERKSKEAKAPVRAVVMYGYAGGRNLPEGVAAACQVVPNVEIFETASGKTVLVLTETRPVETSRKRDVDIP